MQSRCRRSLGRPPASRRHARLTRANSDGANVRAAIVVRRRRRRRALGEANGVDAVRVAR